jgi:uncharacterized protein (DUF427 family)
MDLLRPSERVTRCPRKGDAVYWSVVIGDRTARDAAWAHPEPPAGGPPLSGLVSLYWDAMDEWLEEDEPAVGHARDPYHRVDVLDTSRLVRVRVGGQVVAETRRGRVLFETGLPPRWYIPAEDVRQGLLVPSDTTSVCAYKGTASYWSVRAGDAIERDLVWTYRAPRHDALRIRDLLCFFNERVDIEIDGELQLRPSTPWSPDAAAEDRAVEAALRWPGA